MKLHQHRITVTFDLVSAEKRPDLSQALFALFELQMDTWAREHKCLVSELETQVQMFVPVEPK